MDKYETDYQSLLNSYAKNEQIDQIKAILRMIPNIGAGDRAECWRRFNEENDREALYELLEKLKKGGYSSQLFPAIIGRSSAPNFWLHGEKNEPEDYEAAKALYLLLSSIAFRNTLVNLDNIKPKGRKEWRQLLITEAGPDLSRVIGDLKIKSRRIGPFYRSLLIVTYWLYQLKMQGYKLSDLDELLTDWGITDDTALIIFELGRKKKEVHYFNRISSFIHRWYRDYFEANQEKISVPSLVAFIDSLTQITSSSTNAELVSETREKLVFHLFKYHEINGELLSKLVELKIQDALGSKRPLGIKKAARFFAGLPK